MSVHSAPTFNLFSLMKDVSEALNFDRLDRNEDAYRKYLQCVLRVSSGLLKQLHANEGHMLVTNEDKKMVKLGQQCMDRVAKLVCEKLEKVPKTSVSTPGSLSVSSDVPPQQLTPRSTPTTPTARELTHVSPQITSPDYSSGSSTLRITPGNLPEHHLLSSSESRRMSPMEIAARQNQQLLSAFKKRQTQAKNRSTSTNLGLTLQRKMAENVAIAKAQEQVLAKKMKERQARLEEQAVRRFHTPVGLSEDEQHQRQIYKQVLEFEQENLWLMELRKRIESSPTDITVISEVIVAVLRCESHPLTKELYSHQCKLYDQITALVQSKLKKIESFKVPLSKQVLENANLSSYKSSFHHSSSGLRLSESDTTLCDLTEEDVFNEDSETNLSDQSYSNRELDDNVKFETSTDTDTADIGEVTENAKKDIQTALDKGNKLRHKLEEENKNMKVLSRQVTADYDKYNQENMDDLFDESSGDSDDSESDDVNIRDDHIIGDKITEISESRLASCESKSPDMCIDNTGDSDKEMAHGKHDGNEDLQKKPNLENLDSSIVKLKVEAYQRHLKGITDDILTRIEKVQVLFVIVYEQLASAEGRDQCNVLLEEYFFRPIWNNLLALFRLANEPKEVSLAYIMTITCDYSPDRFGVRDKLCLHGDEESGDYPYRSAVTELLAICQCQTMLEKLDCLVKSSKQVMYCIEQYSKENNEDMPGVGADDLIPILCYIISKTQLPQLVSECHAMDTFIHEGYIMGEEGYCLTSFQTAINYMVSEGITLQST